MSYAFLLAKAGKGYAAWELLSLFAARTSALGLLPILYTKRKAGLLLHLPPFLLRVAATKHKKIKNQEENKQYL